LFQNPQIRRAPVIKGSSATTAGNVAVLPNSIGPQSRIRSPYVTPVDPHLRSDIANPLRIMGFYLALVFIFSRFSLSHELITAYSGFDTHLVILMGVPTIFLTVMTGGIRRAMRGRPAYYWIAFALWLIACIPTSSWRGGSMSLLQGFLKGEFPVMFIIAGLVVTWRECRQMMTAIALAATVNVLSCHFFEVADQQRFRIEVGSISNSNDFVAHLILVLPFVVFVFLTAGNSWLRRFGSLAVITYGLFFAASAGSRGGAVALGAICCFVLLRTTWTQRIVFVIVMALLVTVTVVTMPKFIVKRYATLFTDTSTDQEAIDSKNTRTYLLKSSLRFTLQHPLFGVGPGEFLDYEGKTARESGKHGAWQVAHNSYTQVSSEAGIPALLFAIAAIVSTFRLLDKTLWTARRRPQFKDIASAAFCVEISLVGFCTAIFFLSLIYNFYLLALSGMAIAISCAAQTEFAAGEQRATGAAIRR
jgi:O-antigen ligase